MPENKPVIRFKGFEEDWEQRKLGDAIEKLDGGASIRPTDYQEQGVRTVPKGAVNNSGVADLAGSKFVSEEFFEKNTSSHVESNSLVTSLRDLVPSAPNIGRIVRIGGIDEKFLMPQGVYKLELFANIDENFVIAYSNSEKYRKIISTEKNGSTQVHIRNEKFLNINIPLPSLEEQKKIGTFFKQLDDTITLHQRKLDLLKQMKKGFLQRIFPKNDEKVSTLRFSDFTGEWEQHKLGEIAPLRGGFAFKSNNFKSEGVPIVRISNILSSGKVGNEFVYYDNQEKDENYLLPDEAAVLAMSGATTGKVSILDNPYNHKYYQNQRVGYFIPTKNIDYKFISTIVRSKLFLDQLNSVLVAGAQPNISSKDIGGFEFLVPKNIEEQQNIGILFKQLDSLITLHQEKLDKLVTLKKSYLQKMFI